MSIESAIEGQQGQNQGHTARTRLHGRIVDVHVDKDNPLKSYITVEADPKNNLGMFSGTYNVSLNNELTPPERFGAAARAQERGSGVCGGLINERMIRRKGKPVLLNNFRLTGDQAGTCRWIDFSRKEVHRRAALVHTAAVQSRADQGQSKYARITHVTVLRHQAFDVDDEEAVTQMKQLADRHFAEATRPRNFTVPKDKSDPDGEQLQHLRSSMPRSAFAFVIIDDNTREVLEYSDFLHRRRNFKNSDMPAHFTQEDVKEFRGQYPSLPYNGESIQMALHQVKNYAEKTYGDGGVAPKVLCVEGVRYRTSKVAETTDMQASRPTDALPSALKEMSPVEMTHLANQTQYLASSQDPDKARKVRNCAYVSDVTFQFADNKGDTYSRFIDCKTEYPQLDTPWITQITYQDEPLAVPELMKAPTANAILDSQYAAAPQVPQDSAPEGSKPPEPAEGQAPESPEQESSNAASPEAPAPAGAEAQPSIPENNRIADDPSFADSERLGAPDKASTEAAPDAEASAADPSAEPQASPAGSENPDRDLFHGPGAYTFGP